MSMDPNEPMKSRQAHLIAAAERSFGSERTNEIGDQIEHLARMMTRIAGVPLDLRDAPLPLPTDRNRGVQ